MKKVFKTENLDCANCANKMEIALKKIDGVLDANVSFIMQKIVIEMDENANQSSVIEEMKKVCKRVEPDCVIKW